MVSPTKLMFNYCQGWPIVHLRTAGLCLSGSLCCPSPSSTISQFQTARKRGTQLSQSILTTSLVNCLYVREQRHYYSPHLTKWCHSLEQVCFDRAASYSQNLLYLICWVILFLTSVFYAPELQGFFGCRRATTIPICLCRVKCYCGNNPLNSICTLFES